MTWVFPLPIGRRSFLGALASMVVGGRWLRPRPEPVISIVTANGFSVPPSVMGFSIEPPLHPNCRCVMTTTWKTPHLYLVPGDVIQLKLPDDTPVLFTLTHSSDHGRRMTLRELG